MKIESMGLKRDCQDGGPSAEGGASLLRIFLGFCGSLPPLASSRGNFLTRGAAVRKPLTLGKKGVAGKVHQSRGTVFGEI